MSNKLNINPFINAQAISKQLLQLKPPDDNGFLLQIHNTTEKPKTQQKINIRFIHLSFDKSENILVASNHTGNVVLADLDRSKFWVLPQINTCTAVQFSTHNSSEVIMGMQNGLIYVLNIETAEITAELTFHHHPIVDISFFQSRMCLSASRKEAIIWDLKTNTKIQVLTLIEDCTLKHVMFIPIVGNILACFDDDTIVIWKFETFEVCKELQFEEWQNNSIKSIAFTRNGRAAIFAGHLPQLIIFAVDTWSVMSKIILPDCITSIKNISFIPQMFDGGSNKILAILTGSGSLHFYDMEKNAIINKIATIAEISKFDCSVNGKYISCLLKSGEINIYTGIQYQEEKIEPSPQDLKRRNKCILSTRRRKRLAIVQKKITEFLDVDKLRSILKEFGEYPDTYRPKIWAQLLKLPNNAKQYNSMIDYTIKPGFLNLNLESKTSLLSLKKLLSNLITWCPYFEHVQYLPVFAFPFLNIFHNDPISCFEAVCTIILNWCQNWFEYFPLLPINILAIVENILLEHDHETLRHLADHDITTATYAWPLLESAFSEVLPEAQWCVLWDHILSNEPPFLIMAVVAYNIINRRGLLAIKTKEEFEHFYHNQNITNMKMLITKCYSLLNGTSEKNHPNRYLNSFKGIESSTYPNFVGFPKTFADFNFDEIEKLKREQIEIQNEQSIILTQRQVLTQSMAIAERHRVEEDRIKEMKNACREKIIQETDRVKEQRNLINQLRTQLQLEEIDLLNKSRERILHTKTKEKERTLEKLLCDVKQSRACEEMEMVKAEGDLIKRYSELLHQKVRLEETLQSGLPEPGLSAEYRLLKTQQEKLIESLESIKHTALADDQLKNMTIATGISAMDDLIMKIEMELAKEMANKYEDFNTAHSNMRILKLESETKQLEMEVSKLLALLANVKSQETKHRLAELRDSINSRRNLRKIPGQQYFELPQSSKVDRSCYIHSFKDDFGRLRQMIHKAREPSIDDTVDLESEVNYIDLENT